MGAATRKGGSMFLVNMNGDKREIEDYKNFPRAEFVFTKEKDADDFIDTLLDKRINSHEKYIADLKAKKHKKE